MKKDPLSQAPGVRQRRKEARPAECIAAALDVFVERGFAAAKLDDIAQRVGISKGALYLYFESKEALFKAVVQETLLPTIVEAETISIETVEDPAALLRELVLRWSRLTGGSQAGEIPRLILAEAGNFPEVAKFFFENVVERGRKLLARVLEAGVERGVFRPCDPTLFCNLVLAPVMQHCLWSRVGMSCGEKEIDPEFMVNRHLDIFLHGLLLPRNGEAAR